MKHEFATIENSILEIVGKLNGIEVTSVHAELTEHTITEIVLIIVKLLFLLARLWIGIHVGSNLDGIVGASLLTKCASGTLVGSFLVAFEDKTATEAWGNV